MSNDVHIHVELETHAVGGGRERERESNMCSAHNCLSADMGLRITAFMVDKFKIQAYNICG